MRALGRMLLHTALVSDAAKIATTPRRCSMLLDALASEMLVERPAPGAAPTAFRIWAAGENVADDGPIFFTPRSAQLLMSQQTARARLYSIDFDHLSLQKDRPPTAGRASGWHSLAVRNDAMGQPELWAVGVEWCADAKVGLEQDPPLWRFFSPAFDVDANGEVVSYTNLALCINPMTHGLPELAAKTADTSARKHAMKPAECAAMLAAMADATEDPSKKEAFAMAMAAVNPPAVAADDEADKPEDDKADKTEADGDDKKPEEAAEGEDDKDDKDDKPETKASSKAAATLAAENVKLHARLDRIEIKSEIDKRTDLSESVRAWCLTQSADVVRSFLKKVSRVHNVQRNAAPSHGEGQGAPALLEGEDREQMDREMGMKTHSAKKPERLADGRFVLHTVRPSQMAGVIGKAG